MMAAKDRAKLIVALNTALALYVPGKYDREHFAQIVAEGIGDPFIERFIEACIRE